MSDDLEPTHSMVPRKTLYRMLEMADRIEQLEADKAAWCGIHEGAVAAMMAHIKQLQGALDDVSQYICSFDWHYLKPETIITLERKSDD